MIPLILSALRGPSTFSILGGRVVVAVLSLLIVPPFCVARFRRHSP